MKNDGVAAEKAFEDHWDKIGHCYRLPDKKALTGLNKGARIADFAKPSDYLVSSPNHPLHFAEVKSTIDSVRFAFGKIQKSQSNAALMEAKRGSGLYYFYIFSYPLGQWFYMDCKEYADALATGARSIKFEDLTPWTI